MAMANFYNIPPDRIKKIYVDHPNDIHPDDLKTMRDYHLDALQSAADTAYRTQKAPTENAAAKHAMEGCTKNFASTVDEFKGHGKAWHNWYLDVVDEFARKKGLMEDAPTMSMAGQGIASRDMMLGGALGGAETHLLRRSILSSVLGKVRAKMRTKKRSS